MNLDFQWDFITEPRLRCSNARSNKTLTLVEKSRGVEKLRARGEV